MWSLGCILFEMLVGQTVFAGTTQREVLKNVQEGTIELPPHVAISDVLVKLLQRVRGYFVVFGLVIFLM